MIKKHTKYVPKRGLTIAYLLLLAVVFLLFMGRTQAALRLDQIQAILPGFYQHISNFTISYLRFSGIGYSWLMMGVPFGKIMILGGCIILANFVYELFLPFINTKDIVDAYYGVAGTLLGYLFLYPAGKYGFTPRPAS